MAVNGKTKFPKISSQNYTNILYSDSDSDSIPDLKLPPIKGKKLKRRKDLSGRHSDAYCDFWTMLKLVAGILVFTVLIILGAVCFWSLRRISELQEQVSSCVRPRTLFIL